MPGDAHRILETAALEALEQLGFLLADPEPPADPGPLHGMRVAFEGPFRGALVIRGDDVLLEALATSMLGLDTPPERSLQLDALGEIGNVVCGNVVPLLGDPTSVFRLSAPAPVPHDATGTPLAEAVLGFEGGVVRVEWYGEDR